ncbi:MAG TPA: efflux RND transporter periplasmic adaptor subunit [Patescibacteria group bacterium]|nr:efflux RND transporter periplasmic adaptor subunit [Patescibacteria group bacterium]
MKKKVVIPIAIIVILVLAYSLLKPKTAQVEYTTSQAENGPVIQTVDATGSISSAEDINLNFKSTGKLASLKVKVGDRVKTGDLLATLETAALASRVADARSALIEAEANLEKIIAGATVEDLRISELNVEQKKQDLSAAENNLTNLKLNRDTEVNNLKDTTIVSLNNQLVVAEHAIKTGEDTLANDDADDTLGILNTATINNSAISKVLAKNSLVDAQNKTKTLTTSSTDAEIITAIATTNNCLDTVRQYLSDCFTVLKATITSADLTQSELDALITDIQTEQGYISTAKTAIQTAESNWTNKIAYYIDQISKGENAVEAASDTFQLAEAQLALKKAKPQSYDLKSAEAAVARARAGLSLAEANLGDNIIKAPVDGLITEVNNKIGEQNSLTEPVIKMIGDSRLEIEADIPESDVAKIKIGQTAKITLDSFGEDTIFAGTVTFTNPAEKIIQDVVYYEVKVQFNDNIEEVKPGMTANLTIETNRVDNVLRVPIRAVKQKDGQKFVEVLVLGQPQEKNISTGLRGDEYIEITSGLSAGEEVITFTKTK